MGSVCGLWVVVSVSGLWLVNCHTGVAIPFAGEGVRCGTPGGSGKFQTVRHQTTPAGAARHPFFGKEGDGTATKPTETPIFIGVTGKKRGDDSLTINHTH